MYANSYMCAYGYIDNIENLNTGAKTGKNVFFQATPLPSREDMAASTMKKKQKYKFQHVGCLKLSNGALYEHPKRANGHDLDMV